MRRIILSVALIFAAATAATAQIGKFVGVPAGTPEDAAVSAIYAATDPAQKIALLDKFAAEHPTGDMALLADQLYVSAYMDEKNYDKAFEYGDKALAIDPDNFATAVNLVRAAQEAGDADKMVRYGGVCGGILTRYKASPAPAGISAADWDEKKKETIAGVQQDINYVASVFYDAAYKTADPAAKAKQLEEFAADFSDSPDAINAEEGIVFAYQAAKDTPKMLSAAEKVLKDDPSNVTILVFLADYWSDKGDHLSEAEADANKAIAALPTQTKPEGMTDDQWQQQNSLQRGIALSALGEIDVLQGRNLPAIKTFEEASPLLKPNAFSYGRNLYRWGFTLAKMRRIPEARRILTQAVDTKSAYSGLAEQTLNRIGGPLGSSH
jgi:tetratricopeptide (TPR) repeat protein